MTAAWFEIDPARDRAPIEGRYVLRDPWGDYARPGEVVAICFAGTADHGRALVTGHTIDGHAVLLPLDPAVILIHSDPPGSYICSGISTTNVRRPLPARPASGSATGGEAS